MEIRFRGKRIDNGEWVYGSLLSNTPDGKYFIQSNDYRNKSPIEVKMESVGQFTGLYNYYSESIYEGDICRFDGKLYEVKRECDRMGSYWAETGFILDEIGVDNFIRFTETIDDWFSEIYVDIAGNIHDNKELLKGE